MMMEDKAQARTEHISTKERPFQFVDSGLDNVYLIGIKYYTYPDGRIVPEIPAIKKLMQLIARGIIESEAALNPAEIRFLRKRLGQKQSDFASALGINDETLSRYENGHQSPQESIDKLIRFYYAFKALDDDNLNELRDEIMRAIQAWKELQYANQKKPVVAKVTNDEWELQAA